jgi:hypothetical protein
VTEPDDGPRERAIDRIIGDCVGREPYDPDKIAWQDYPPTLHAFTLSEDMTLRKPWAKAVFDDPPFGWQADNYVWNPVFGCDAWDGLYSFRGKNGDRGFCLLSKNFYQPEDGRPMPLIVFMQPERAAMASLSASPGLVPKQ